jgi:nucleoside-diphosphate-sugar epimerase
VTKEEFIGRVAELAGLPRPTRHIPLGLARVLATVVERAARLRGAKNPPLINKARFKFLGLNLDYSIEKARRVLGYDPPYTTEQGLVAALADLAPRAPAG